MEVKRKTPNAQRRTPNIQCREAFTLIELLVVIGIIAILLGLVFPVFQGVLERAKKVQAKNDLTQVVTAVNAFNTEYGRYPIDSSVTTDSASTYGTGGTSSKAVFDELRGITANLNTRKIVFISPAEDPSQTSPKGKIGSDGQFHDPWTSAYVIRIDADYDNQISPNPYGNNKGAGPDPIRQGVIAWSFGKDTKIGNNGDQKFTSSDDVVSWQ
jgi:prepilin-type N-terminal cleavage/methylation domain-containing protein